MSSVASPAPAEPGGVRKRQRDMREDAQDANTSSALDVARPFVVSEDSFDASDTTKEKYCGGDVFLQGPWLWPASASPGFFAEHSMAMPWLEALEMPRSSTATDGAVSKECLVKCVAAVAQAWQKQR